MRRPERPAARPFGDVRPAAAAALLLGLLPLAVAWFAQDRMGLVPCALCLLERWPYRALLLLGLLALLVPARTARLVLLLGTAPLIAALVLSTAHVGVEQGLWPDPLPQCIAPRWHGGSIADQLAAMPRRPAKPCDAPTRLLAAVPLSMASLDVIYALLSSVIVVSLARRRIR